MHQPDKMAKKKRVHLPEEVINEILLRLPVKSVLRCRCVCKSWLSLISDPNFAISHFQLAASPTHKLLIFKDCREALSTDFNASPNHDSAYHSLSLDFLSPRPYCPEIVGSCRGFLLLECDSYRYLWNPSTGVNTKIPASPINHNFDILNSLFGLAYEPSTDDYLVVWGPYVYNHGYAPVPSSIDLDIFSLRAHKWKKIDIDSHLPYEDTIHSKNRVGLFLNGAIHWIVHNHETKRDVIIAFDLKETRISEIALPDDFYSENSFGDYDLLVFGELISAWIVENYTVKIWVMHEYSMNSSWTQTLVFSMHPVPDFSLISFTNCGDIVGTDRRGGLVKFNDKGRLLEHHSYLDRFSQRSQMVVYTESLLSFPGGGEQA